MKLGSKLAAPFSGKKTLLLVILLLMTTGSGLAITPILTHYPSLGLSLVFIGVLVANLLSAVKQQAALGALLTIGLTLVAAAGTMNLEIAQSVVQTLALCMLIAIGSQHLACRFFPMHPMEEQPAPESSRADLPASWIALRATLIIFPAFMVALINPSLYLPLIMKAASLGLQESIQSARHAARELLGSTLLGGAIALAFWYVLKINPSLWMFFLIMLWVAIYGAAKIIQLTPSRFSPSYWVNTLITLMILLGPAVEDSAGDEDVSHAFLIRITLFLVVTFYAILLVGATDSLYKRKHSPIALPQNL